jgi:hypothetical protein
MGQSESIYTVYEVLPQSLLVKDYNEDDDIEFFEDLFYLLTDEFLLSSFTPGFTRILISSKLNNIYSLIRRIHKDFLLFLTNPNPLYYPDIITRIHTLSVILSVFFEAAFSDAVYDFFWKTEDTSSIPFGRVLIHTIMNLFFVSSTYPPTPVPKKFVKITSTLFVNRALLWYGIDL